jgi:hypothetical protein
MASFSDRIMALGFLSSARKRGDIDVRIPLAHPLPLAGERRKEKLLP